MIVEGLSNLSTLTGRSLIVEALLKNTTQNRTASYSRLRVSPSGANYPGSGSTTWIQNRCVCPVGQNSGDGVRGTNFYYTITKCSPFVGSYNYYINGYGAYTGSGTMTSVTPRRVLDASALSDASNEVIQNLLQKIRGQLDLSVDCFQMKQTLRMIANPIRGLARFIKSFRAKTWKAYISRKWKNRPSWSLFFSNKWLEAIYGWYPFVQTAYGIAAQAGQINKPGPSLQLFTATTGIDNAKTVTELQNFAGQDHYVSVASHERAKLKAFCLLKLSDSAKAKMAATYTSMNPASIRWELTPLSFVVDWFYGIGDYLRSCESAMIYNHYVDSFWLSTTRVTNTQLIGLPWVPSSTRRGGISGSATGQEISFQRKRFDVIPLPTRPKNNFADGLHWTQLTSALALLRKAFG